MLLAALLLAIILMIVVHEAGHAWAMNRLGVEIKRYSIGFGVGFLPHLELRVRGLLVEIHPLILGGFVEPTNKGQKRLKELKYNQAALIYSAGVWSNFLIFLVLRSLYFLWVSWIEAVVSLFLALVCYLGRGFFCRWVVPFAGILLVSILAYAYFQYFFGSASTLPVGGPVTLIGQAREASGIYALGFLASVSLALALFNSIPIRPFDGGHIASSLIKEKIGERAKRIFDNVSSLVGLAFIAFVILGDFLKF